MHYISTIPILAYQSHMRASTQGSGFIGPNTHLQHVQVIITFLNSKATEYFAEVPGVSITTLYSIVYSEHCVERSEKCLNFIQWKKADE